MKNKITVVAAIAALALTSLGCQTGNTGGGDIDHSDGFAPGGSGSISLVLNSRTITTGQFDGFRVSAKDEDGAPVPDLRITCDTEAGLALIEPTAGFETTDSNGEISGKVGCERSGSYLMICRAPAPSSTRDSMTIICQGDRPTGFTGFPGSAGGGLGGGSVDNNTIAGIRIAAISVTDTGSFDAFTTSIDTVHNACADATTTEPFFDSSVRFSIVNNSPYVLTFKSLKYVVANAYTGGASGTSGTLSLTGSAAQAVDANGGTGMVDSLLFPATGGTKSVYNGSPISDGFKNITFTLTGTNELGETFQVKASTALSFGNFNRCVG